LIYFLQHITDVGRRVEEFKQVKLEER